MVWLVLLSSAVPMAGQIYCCAGVLHITDAGYPQQTLHTVSSGSAPCSLATPAACPRPVHLHSGVPPLCVHANHVDIHTCPGGYCLPPDKLLYSEDTGSTAAAGPRGCSRTGLVRHVTGAHSGLALIPGPASVMAVAAPPASSPPPHSGLWRVPGKSRGHIAPSWPPADCSPPRALHSHTTATEPPLHGFAQQLCQAP
jgi:hypothetical protein